MTDTATEEKKPQVELPHAVRRYISDAQKAECDSNQCDHRPAFQDALDSIANKATEQYLNGLEWVKTITQEEVGQCSAYFEFRKKNAHRDSSFRYCSSYNYVTHRVEKFGWVLVPMYYTVIDSVRELSKIFNPPKAPNA